MQVTPNYESYLFHEVDTSNTRLPLKSSIHLFSSNIQLLVNGNQIGIVGNPCLENVPILEDCLENALY